MNPLAAPDECKQPRQQRHCHNSPGYTNGDNDCNNNNYYYNNNNSDNNSDNKAGMLVDDLTAAWFLYIS